MNKSFVSSNAWRAIENGLKQGKLPHAMIIRGDDVAAADEFARAIAKKLLGACDACDKCNSCLEINAKSHPDFFYFEPTNGLISVAVTSAVIDAAYKAPQYGDKKVIFISEFDKMNVQAQNKLLKTLEEPPVSAVFLLTAQKIERVLPTVRSRASILDAPTLKIDETEQILLKEGVDGQKARLSARVARGNLSIAKSLSVLKNPEEPLIAAKNYLSSLTDSREANKSVAALLSNADILPSTLAFLQQTLCDMLHFCYNQGEDGQKGDSELEELSKRFSVCFIAEAIEVISDALMNLTFFVNAAVVADALTFRLLEVKNRCR